LDKSKLLKKYTVLDPDIIAIQETKIDRNILTSELFQDNINYDVYRNDRTLNGGGVIYL
jgi:exonuclease III